MKDMFPELWMCDAGFLFILFIRTKKIFFCEPTNHGEDTRSPTIPSIGHFCSDEAQTENGQTKENCVLRFIRETPTRVKKKLISRVKNEKYRFFFVRLFIDLSFTCEG